MIAPNHKTLFSLLTMLTNQLNCFKKNFLFTSFRHNDKNILYQILNPTYLACGCDLSKSRETNFDWFKNDDNSLGVLLPKGNHKLGSVRAI